MDNPYTAKLANYEDNILNSISYLENEAPTRTGAYLSGALPGLGPMAYADSNSPTQQNSVRDGAITLGTIGGGLLGLAGGNRIGRLLRRSGIMKNPMKARHYLGAGAAGAAVGGGETAYQAAEQDRLDQLRMLYAMRG